MTIHGRTPMRKTLAIAAIIATTLCMPAVVSAAELPAADMEFAKQAAAAGMAEVEMGKLGVEKATDQAVREFGQRMIDDHMKANDELIKLLEGKQIQIPAELPPDATATKEQMNALSGGDFDRQYMTHMVMDHEKAVDLFTKQAESGQDPDLKQFAEKTLPTLKD